MTDEEKAAQEAEDKRKAEEADAEAKRRAEEDDKGPKTLEEAKALVEKERKDRQEANRQAAALRIENKAFKEAEEKRKQSEMSDAEKAAAETARLNEENGRLRQEARDAKIVAKAATLGFADPDDAPKLMDMSKLNDDHSNVEDLLKDLAKGKPYLIKTGDGESESQGRGLFQRRKPGGSQEEVEDSKKQEKARSMFSAVKRRVPT